MTDDHTSDDNPPNLDANISDSFTEFTKLSDEVKEKDFPVSSTKCPAALKAREFIKEMCQRLRTSSKSDENDKKPPAKLSLDDSVSK